MNDIPEVDIGGISAAYERRVRALCDGQFPAALLLEDRLDPGRWALEWHLATWLGECLGVDGDALSEITLSNVLGLASLRLQDDIADGELVADGEPAASFDELARALYDAALDVYRARFPASSPFWAQLELRMGEWRAATFGPTDVWQRDLALRGAPLKISAFAICLLAAREGDFGSIEVMLDHALTAMVLYDHFVDWREDIAAGRSNAFVERALDLARSHRRAAIGEQDVAVSMLTTDAIDTHFALIAHELDSAIGQARTLRVHGLARHLRTLSTTLDQQGRAMAARYRELAERGQSLLFRSYPQRAA